MLCAVNKDTNEKLYSYCSQENIIRTLSQERKLICPHCDETVIYHHGIHKIAHFKHKSECKYRTEPETEEHSIGKVLLYKRFKELYRNSDVELEVRIPETNQIADLLITHPTGDRWAIEYQCSKIPAGKWLERHELYKSAEINDIWIFGNWNYGIEPHNKFQKTIEEYQGFMAIFSIDEDKAENYLDDGRIITNYIKYSFKLNGLIIKKYEDIYRLDDIDHYKSSDERYIISKKKVTEHFRRVYGKAEILNDFKIEGSNFKVDILIISSKGGVCGISFERFYSKPNDWLEKKKKLDDLNIFTFYFYVDLEIERQSPILNAMNNELRNYYIFDTLTNKVAAQKIWNTISLNNLRMMDIINKYELVDKEIEKKRELSYKDRKVIYKKKTCPKCKGEMRLYNLYGKPVYQCLDYKKCGYYERLDDVICPYCNIRMWLRYDNEIKKSFWICSQEPKCDYSVDIELEG